MTGYYYDCFIQALYMTREFDVDVSIEFKIIAPATDKTSEVNSRKSKTIYKSILELYEEIWGFVETYKLVKDGTIGIVVNQESNHIFQPTSQDVVFSNDIIMRDGKHFFMPKQKNHE